MGFSVETDSQHQVVLHRGFVKRDEVKLYQSYRKCKHSAPNCNPVTCRIGQWSTRAKKIDVSHSKHAKLGFGFNETLAPWRPKHNTARLRGCKWLRTWGSKENNSLQWPENVEHCSRMYELLQSQRLFEYIFLGMQKLYETVFYRERGLVWHLSTEVSVYSL